MPRIQGQRRAGIGRRARPQREPLVVFAGQHHVLRPRLAKHRRPLVGIPLPALFVKRLGKLVVVVMRPVMLAIVRLGRRPRDAHRVQIPLGIGVVLDVIVVAKVVVRMIQRRPSRHRIKPPVNEDAQLGPRVPLRQRMLVQRLNRRLILHRRLRRAHAADRHNNTCNQSEKPFSTRHVCFPLTQAMLPPGGRKSEPKPSNHPDNYSGFRIAVPKGNTLKSTRPQGAATSQ